MAVVYWQRARYALTGVHVRYLLVLPVGRPYRPTAGSDYAMAERPFCPPQNAGFCMQFHARKNTKRRSKNVLIRRLRVASTVSSRR